MFGNWKSQCLCYQNQELPITYYAPWKYNCDLSLSRSLILSFSSSLLSRRWIKPHTPSPRRTQICAHPPPRTRTSMWNHIYWHGEWNGGLDVYTFQKLERITFPLRHNISTQSAGKTITPKMSNGASFKNRLWHEPARLLGETQREEEDFRMFLTHTYLAHEY